MMTQDELKKLVSYDKETGMFFWRVSPAPRIRVGDAAGGIRTNGRVKIGFDDKHYLAHRLAWLYVYGEWPKGHIDHINGDPADNRISNLREATNSENMQNLRKPRSDNKVGLLGVSLCGRTKRWVSQISIKGKKHYLGHHDSPEDAHSAYVAAKTKLHPFSTLGGSHER